MNASDIDYILAAKSEIGADVDDFKKVIFIDAFRAGKEWYSLVTENTCKVTSKKMLANSCTNYIYDSATFTNRPSGFIPSIIWWWAAKAIISWIVNRIIDHIIKNDRPNKR